MVVFFLWSGQPSFLPVLFLLSINSIQPQQLDQRINMTQPLETFFEIFSKEAEIAFSSSGLKMMLSLEPFLPPRPAAVCLRRLRRVEDEGHTQRMGVWQQFQSKRETTERTYSLKILWFELLGPSYLRSHPLLFFQVTHTKTLFSCINQFQSCSHTFCLKKLHISSPKYLLIIKMCHTQCLIQTITVANHTCKLFYFKFFQFLFGIKNNIIKENFSKNEIYLIPPM